jgi:adenylate cyclase
MVEIERKFLVKADFMPFVTRSNYIIQGYLSSVPERTVRVRISDHKGYLTIKGATDATGISRFEWEKEITEDEAKALLPLCEKGMIEKWRYIVPSGESKFEVDQFLGANEGLVIAEIELPDKDAAFEKPAWLGEEVTGELHYYNANLTKNPYSEW